MFLYIALTVTRRTKVKDERSSRKNKYSKADCDSGFFCDGSRANSVDKDESDKSKVGKRQKGSIVQNVPVCSTKVCMIFPTLPQCHILTW